jgi:alcohol dehydrogenase class IV
MKFEFATATRIIFGPESIKIAAPAATEMGRHAFVLTGRNVKRSAWLFENLKRHRLEFTPFSTCGEPTTDSAFISAQRARSAGCDVVIAVGGGSVIDTGKVVAALLTNSGNLMDYLEIIGQGRQLVNNSAPCIAIPTTAGTGAEVTRNSVLGSPEHRVKVSMRSPLMLPRLALIDPELTYSMPPSITATTGLDAFTQLLEAFVSNRPNPITDGLCREGLNRAARALPRVYEDGNDLTAREDMCVSSLFGGLALANAKLGAVHGIAGPFGGMFPAAHGAVCARLLPHVMAANVKALQRRAAESPMLERYVDAARILTRKSSARAEDGAAWVLALCTRLQAPPLSAHGFREADIPALVEKSRKASSMQGNPIKLADEELMEILQKAL